MTVYTTSNGRPVTYYGASQTVGSKGPILLQDFHLIDLLAHFDRERIPERVVHAKGAGAFGESKVIHDITDIVSHLFIEVGKKTKVAARFSTVGGEKGSSDTARDPRRFSIKFYTEEGNWDMVGKNTPIFFIRDGVKFPTFTHTQKRNPQTNLKDATAFWDFLSSNQESIHQTMYLFTDRGTPYSYRYQNTYAAHTFQFTKPDGSFKYIKLHLISDQSEKNMTNEEAAKMASVNPDWHTEDLFNAIERGAYPSWTLYVQILDPKEAENFRRNIFDVTTVWPHNEVPMRPVGKLTLNRSPANYFAEIEQVAFAPAHLVPGIQPTADAMLQARLLSYADSQRHRLGVNYQQIPVNTALHSFQSDGFMAINGNGGLAPNYASTLRPYEFKPVDVNQEHETWIDQAVHNLQPVTDEDYVQANMFWEMLEKRTLDEQDHLVHNASSHPFTAVKEVRERTYEMFDRVNGELGSRIREATEGARLAADNNTAKKAVVNHSNHLL